MLDFLREEVPDAWLGQLEWHPAYKDIALPSESSPSTGSNVFDEEGDVLQQAAVGFFASWQRGTE